MRKSGKVTQVYTTCRFPGVQLSSGRYLRRSKNLLKMLSSLSFEKYLHSNSILLVVPDTPGTIIRIHSMSLHAPVQSSKCPRCDPMWASRAGFGDLTFASMDKKSIISQSSMVVGLQELEKRKRVIGELWRGECSC